jgi:hypothetical protein
LEYPEMGGVMESACRGRAVQVDPGLIALGFSA